MQNYESPTIESAGSGSIKGTYLYYETTVWHTQNSTVDTKYLVFSFAALAVYALEIAFLLLSNPPEER
ncbi:hypothetical protein [Caldisericum sp.]|uniref:hypothetical protein n=1 Tax=Caldisericum sp. TaxID=2499687 RepID=UPI003D0A00F1